MVPVRGEPVSQVVYITSHPPLWTSIRRRIRSNTVALAGRTRSSIHCAHRVSQAMPRVPKTGSNSANFMLHDCDNDQPFDQPRSTTTTTFSGSSPGSVVADSARRQSAVSTARHGHSTGRRGSWSSGNLYDQRSSPITTRQQDQQQSSQPSRPETAASVLPAPDEAASFGTGRLARVSPSGRRASRFHQSTIDDATRRQLQSQSWRPALAAVQQQRPSQMPSVPVHDGAGGSGSARFAPAASSIASGAGNHATRSRSTATLATSGPRGPALSATFPRRPGVPVLCS